MSDRKIPITYCETFTPPRCRKPRTRFVDDVMEYDFRRVSSKDAPIAFVQHHRSLPLSRSYYEFGNGRKIEYRLFEGELWAPARLSLCICLNGKRNRRATVKDVHLNYWRVDYSATKEQMIEVYKDHLDNKWIIVDGVLHVNIGEPVFCVVTFGFGNNHGGTGIFVNNYYNSNLPASSYFRIDERDKAIQYFKQVAKERGDTESLKLAKYAEKFEILIPSAITRNPMLDHGEVQHA